MSDYFRSPCRALAQVMMMVVYYSADCSLAAVPGSVSLAAVQDSKGMAELEFQMSGCCHRLKAVFRLHSSGRRVTCGLASPGK